MKNTLSVTPGITDEETNKALAWMLTSLENVLDMVWYFKITGAMENEYRFDIEQR